MRDSILEAARQNVKEKEHLLDKVFEENLRLQTEVEELKQQIQNFIEEDAHQKALHIIDLCNLKKVLTAENK